MLHGYLGYFQVIVKQAGLKWWSLLSDPEKNILCKLFPGSLWCGHFLTFLYYLFLNFFLWKKILIAFIYFVCVPWCTCGGQRVTWCWVDSLLPPCEPHSLIPVIGLVVIYVFGFWDGLLFYSPSWLDLNSLTTGDDLELVISSPVPLRLQAWATPCFMWCWNLTQGFLHASPALCTLICIPSPSPVLTERLLVSVSLPAEFGLPCFSFAVRKWQ